jgi:hypothetical protein
LVVGSGAADVAITARGSKDIILAPSTSAFEGTVGAELAVGAVKRIMRTIPDPRVLQDCAAIATFRMITSQFYVNGHVKQSDIVRAFGVTSISVKRSVKIYQDKGPKGFYALRVTRGPAVLVEDMVSEIEGYLAGGATLAEVAKTLGVKLNTIQKAVREGRIRAPVKKNSLAMLR